MKHCSVDTCDKTILARGWCSAHYSLWRKHGKPERVIGKHGRNLRDPTYLSWSAMIARCERGKYKNRFTICNHWLGADGFVNFLSDVGERPPGHTLDRIDNTTGYKPENCRWATPAEQSLNKSVNRLVVYNGVIKPLAAHCVDIGAPYNATLKRLMRGWSVDRAFNEPLRKS